MMRYWATAATVASFQLAEPHNTEGQLNTSKSRDCTSICLYLCCIFRSRFVRILPCVVLCLYWRATEDIKKYRLQCIWSHFPKQFGADNERGKCGRWQDLVSEMFYFEKQNWMLHFSLKEGVAILNAQKILPINCFSFSTANKSQLWVCQILY